MSSLFVAHLSGKVNLIISCDGNSGSDVVSYVNSIEWSYGDFKVIQQGQQLGVDRHNLACMRMSEIYEHIVIIEDDLVVSPYFQEYLNLAVPIALHQDNIAGVSLYRYPIIEENHFPFELIPNNEFLYYQQRSSSKGCFYSWKQLKPYFDFLDRFDGDFHKYSLPNNVVKWGDEVWEKSFYCFLQASNKFISFPRFSLSTDFADIGVHMKKQTLKYIHQSPLYLSEHFGDFKSLDDTANAFDAYYELLPSKLSQFNVTLQGYDVSVDLYGHKKLDDIKSEYLISSKQTKDQIMGWERRLKPEVNNVLLNQTGTFYSFAKTECFSNKKTADSLKERFLYYFPDTKLSELVRMKFSEVVSRFF